MADVGKVASYVGVSTLVLGGVGALAMGAYQASRRRPWKRWAIGGAVAAPLAAAIGHRVYLKHRRDAIVAAGYRDGVALRAKYPGLPSSAIVLAMQAADKFGPSFDATWNSEDKTLYRQGFEAGLAT